MFEWEIRGKHFHIREARTESEFHAIESIQKEAWGFSDLDVVPAANLIAAQWCGAVVLCAYEDDEIIGFAYGFPAYMGQRVSMHSHMLAVRPAWRNYQTGFFLKLAQRNCALEMGLDEMTWTYDPLQSLNAHLNFSKLGVISRRYIVNFYGEATSSPLHAGFGTDRLWVSWQLNSERVRKRIDRTLAPYDSTSEAEPAPDLPGSLPRLVYARDDRPETGDLADGLNGQDCLIEIPNGINDLKQRDPTLGKQWREVTRTAFLAAIDSGFTVQDFFGQKSEKSPRWFYKLSCLP